MSRRYARLTDDAKDDIRVRYKKGETIASLSRMFGPTRMTIRKILKTRKTKTPKDLASINEALEKASKALPVESTLKERVAESILMETVRDLRVKVPGLKRVSMNLETGEIEIERVTVHSFKVTE